MNENPNYPEGSNEKERFDDAVAAYREIVVAAVDILAKFDIRGNPFETGGFLFGLEDSAGDYAHDFAKQLRNNGCEADFYDGLEQFHAAMAAKLAKPRRPVLTNPATHVQIEANSPVGVRSGDAVQFINRE